MKTRTMPHDRLLVVAISLLLTFPALGQKKVVSTPLRQVNVDSLLQMPGAHAYGTLQPGIMTLLADSGAVKTQQKTGRWSQYQYQGCAACKPRPLRYDSLVYWTIKDPGSVMLIKETGTYRLGKREGVWYHYESYRMSPPFAWSLVREVVYQDDTPHGWQIDYGYIPPDSVLGFLTPRSYTSGKRYLDHGVATGRVFEFNESGDTVVMGQLVDGREEGLFRYRYDTMATGRFDRMYDHGRQVETLYYHRNGNVASRGLLIDHTPHGIFRSYNEAGNLIVEQSYKTGVLDGPSHFFYEDGKRMASETFVNGQSNGRRVRYYRNGQISDEVMMRNDKPWTVLTCFDPQGKSKNTGTLKNGTGSLKRYNDAGQLAAIEFYQDGDLLETQQR